VYITVFEKCQYHFSHKKMLSKMFCYNQQHDWYKDNCHLIKMHRDYAEAITQVLEGQIQSDHFGYVPTCSNEGICVWLPDVESVCSYEEGEIPKESIHRTMKFHSHFLDDSSDNSCSHGPFVK
jgi:hypothetical protein